MRRWFVGELMAVRFFAVIAPLALASIAYGWAAPAKASLRFLALVPAGGLLLLVTLFLCLPVRRRRGRLERVSSASRQVAARGWDQGTPKTETERFLAVTVDGSTFELDLRPALEAALREGVEATLWVSAAGVVGFLACEDPRPGDIREGLKGPERRDA